MIFEDFSKCPEDFVPPSQPNCFVSVNLFATGKPYRRFSNSMLATKGRKLCLTGSTTVMEVTDQGEECLHSKFPHEQLNSNKVKYINK